MSEKLLSSENGVSFLDRFIKCYECCKERVYQHTPNLPKGFESKSVLFSLKEDTILITKPLSSSATNHEKDEWHAAKSDKVIPVKYGVYYFEIKITSFGQSGGQFAIGIGSQRCGVSRNAPGLDQESYGLHLRTGMLHACGVQSSLVSPTAPEDGMILGCGVNFLEDEIFFTRNGQLLGRKRQINLLRESKNSIFWHPMLAVKGADVELVPNFGPSFSYNLQSYICQQQYSELGRAHDLYSQVTTNELELRELVLHFLLERGYSRSAEALLQCSSMTTRHDLASELQVIHSRLQIGTKLHAGNYSEAIQLIEKDWPEFSKMFPNLHFKLLVMNFRTKVGTYLCMNRQFKSELGQIGSSPPVIISPTLRHSNDLVSHQSINSRLRNLQAEHFHKHPSTVLISSKTFGDTHNSHTNGSAFHQDELMDIDGSSDEAKPSRDSEANSTNVTILTDKEFDDLLNYGSTLMEKALELKGKKSWDAEFYHLLNKLYCCIASGELPNGLQASTEMSLIRNVDAVLLTAHESLAPRLLKEFEKFEKASIVDKISLKRSMFMHVQRPQTNPQSSSLSMLFDEGTCMQ